MAAARHQLRKARVNWPGQTAFTNSSSIGSITRPDAAVLKNEIVDSFSLIICQLNIHLQVRGFCAEITRLAIERSGTLSLIRRFANSGACTDEVVCSTTPIKPNMTYSPRSA
jgi:hypothetical protein